MKRRHMVLGAALGLAVAVTLIIVLRGNGSTHVPEGGSSFRTAAEQRPHPGTTLLDALAGALAGTSASEAHAARTTPSTTTTTTTATTRAGGTADVADQAAQLFLVGFGGTRADPALVRRVALHRWGGLVLDRNNGETPKQVGRLIAGLRRGTAGAASGRGASAAADGPLIAAVTPGGFNAVPGVGPPPESTARTDAQATAQALRAGRRLRALGVTMILGPSADVGVAGGPWAGRAFSDDPKVVSRRAAAAVTGWERAGILPIPGHYPGEGAASGDPSIEQATVGLGLQDLANNDMAAFGRLLDTVQAIQLSSASYVAFDGVTPATLLLDTVSLLRHQGFGGAIVSGDLAAASLATGESVADVAVEALKAGCDLLWVPGDAADQDAAWRAVVRAIRSGEVPALRVRTALQRAAALRRAAHPDRPR